jgi:hypothetical protein
MWLGAVGLNNSLFVAGAVTLQINGHRQAGDVGSVGFNMYGQGRNSPA